MRKWRETASESAQTDLDRIVGPAIELAQGQLRERGEFSPFGITLDSSNDLQVHAVQADSFSTSGSVIAGLIAKFTSQRESLRAAAIVADAYFPDLDSDGIRVVLEHAEGVALAVVLPYRNARPGHSAVAYGDIEAREAEGYIWPNPSGKGI